MPAKSAATKGTDLTKVCQEIALGRHDDRLPELHKALGGRFVAMSAKPRWRFTVTVDDELLTVDEDNLTIDEMEDAERMASCTWLTLDPRGSARKAKAMIVAALMHRRGLTESEAREKVAPLTVMDLTAAFSEYVTDADPFPSADPST